MTDKSGILRRTLVGAACSAVLLAGCSSGNSGGSSTTTPSGSSGSLGSSADPGTASSPTGDVSTQLDKFRQTPTFTAPGPAISVASLRGKRVFILPLSDNSFQRIVDDNIKAAVNAAGLEATVYPTRGTAPELAQAVSQAVDQKYDLIVLSSPDPKQLQPQLRAAAQAGIPVISAHYYDITSTPAPACAGCAAGVVALEKAPFSLGGKLMADWVIDNAKGGNINALVPVVSGMEPTPPMVAAIQKEFDTYAKNAKVKILNIPFSDFASNALANDIQASLSADSGINYILPQVDAMVPATVSALQTAGRAGKVQIATYNGSPDVLRLVKDGGVGVDVGESPTYIGYATADTLLRVLLKQPVVDENTPVRVWDSSNIADAGNPASFDKGYGTDFIAGFRALWGLT